MLFQSLTDFVIPIVHTSYFVASIGGGGPIMGDLWALKGLIEGGLFYFYTLVFFAIFMGNFLLQVEMYCICRLE